MAELVSRLLQTIKQAPRMRTLVWVSLVFCLIASLDYLTGLGYSFALFYLGLAVVVGIVLGFKFGQIVALLDAILWTLAAVLSGFHYSNVYVFAWSFLTHFVICSVPAALASRLATQLERGVQSPLPRASRSRQRRIVWDAKGVSLESRSRRNRHQPLAVWLTGLSASGKSTLAGKVETILFDKGYSVVRLDGDNLRHGLSGDLGFSDTDRSENLRRAGFVARLMFDQGHIVLCTFISPFRADRQSIRNLFPKDHFTEVFVKASLAVCELRDPKGLYREARLGHLPSMTGVDSPYEVPESPELTLDTELFQADALAQELVDFVIFHSKNSEKPIAK